MKTCLFILSVSVLVVVAVACTASQPPAPPAPEPEFRPTATVRDIMQTMIDPNADFIWQSVASIISAEGTQERRPSTDEEWAELRNRAVTMLEASNLLLVRGRAVAKPGQTSEFPELELRHEEIATLIDGDRAAWTERAHTLHDKTLVALNAIESKDADALLNSGDGIDQACEGCHIKYWYPKDSEAVRLYEERMKEAQGQ